MVGSPLSAAATFTPALSTTVANLRALRAMRDALRAADALAASMENNEESRWRVKLKRTGPGASRTADQMGASG